MSAAYAALLTTQASASRRLIPVRLMQQNYCDLISCNQTYGARRELSMPSNYGGIGTSAHELASCSHRGMGA